jgi:hypothetical protein
VACIALQWLQQKGLKTVKQALPSEMNIFALPYSPLLKKMFTVVCSLKKTESYPASSIAVHGPYKTTTWNY